MKKSNDVTQKESWLDILKHVLWAIAAVACVSLVGVSWVMVSLAQSPIEFAAEGGIDCGAAVDGNLQFNGREVNLTPLREQFSFVNRTSGASVPAVWYYPLTDRVQAELIKVPDFQQARLTHLDANCKVNGAVEGSMPALMLISAVQLNPSMIARTLELSEVN